MCEHEGIVKLLLERKDLNPEIPDLRGETALGLPMSRGQAGIVQLLSEPRPSLPPTSVPNQPKTCDRRLYHKGPS